MRQSLDQACHGILAAALFRSYFVDHIHNILPVLRREVLVGCLGYRSSPSVFRIRTHSITGGIHTDNIVERILLSPKHDGVLLMRFLYAVGSWGDIKEMRVWFVERGWKPCIVGGHGRLEASLAGGGRI